MHLKKIRKIRGYTFWARHEWTNLPAKPVGAAHVMMMGVQMQSDHAFFLSPPSIPLFLRGKVTRAHVMMHGRKGIFFSKVLSLNFMSA